MSRAGIDIRNSAQPITHIRGTQKRYLDERARMDAPMAEGLPEILVVEIQSRLRRGIQKSTHADGQVENEAPEIIAGSSPALVK